MKLVQQFAMLNRQAMMDEILKGMKLHAEERFTTIHNYIDTDAMILRKGAVSARAGEKLLIPINMRDGSLICLGRGNEDWNFSTPTAQVLKIIRPLYNFKAGEETILAWADNEGYPTDAVYGPEGELDPQGIREHTEYDTLSLAKFAFSLFWRALNFAEEQKVPILLDY